MNSSLRLEVAGYYSRLDEVGVVLDGIDTQYFLELEPFLAKNTVYSDIAYSMWLEDIPAPPFSTDLNSLSRNPELWNWITLRLEAEITTTSKLEDAQAAGDALKNSLLDYLRQ